MTKKIEIKKLIILLLKIILIIFLVISLNLVFMPKYINENPDGRIVAEYYREKYDPQVLFLGSSTVYSAVSPVYMYEKYGFTSYVRATSSQPSWVTYNILKESLKYHTPKLVCIDIGFNREADDYAEEVSNRKVYDYMRFSDVKIEGIKDAAADIESITDYMFPIFRYHSRWNDLEFDDFKYAFYKPSVTYNGYIIDYITEAPDSQRVSMDEADDHPLTSRNEDYLRRTIELCMDNSIDVMLMKVPSYNAKWGPVLEADFNRIAKEYNIEYKDYDSCFDEFDWEEDTPDGGSHLNTLGAEIFSGILGADIASMEVIKEDNLDSDVIRIWQDKTERYENNKIKLRGE